MALISSAVTSAIVIFAVTTAPILFSRKSKSVKAKLLQNGRKSIDYSNFIFWMLYGGGALLTVVGVLVYFFSNEPEAGMGFIVLGLILLLPSVLLQFVDTTVNWSQENIYGAKSGWSFKKNLIAWDEVVLMKLHPNKTIQIKDNSGKSVYWSVYYNGWHEIISDLRRIRTDIDTSDFE